MDRLEELKNKYAAVIGAMKLGGVRVDNLDVRENRLFVRGAAPTDDIKNSIWDQIKDVDPKFADLNFDPDSASQHVKGLTMITCTVRRLLVNSSLSLVF